MKRTIYLSLLSFTAFILFSYSTGVFSADYTGSTGLGQSCAQIGCHEGAGGTAGVDSSRLVVKVLNASNVDVDSYTPGQQYDVEIKFKLLGATRVGFQCTNLFIFSNNPAGSVANNVMPTWVQKYTDGSGREYMSHTDLGNGANVISGGYAIWKYKWTAPAVAGSAINFHCAVNRSNSDFFATGDSIMIFIKTLQKPSGVNDVSFNNSIKLYPNPCTDFFDIQHDYGNIHEMGIVDLFGRHFQVTTSKDFKHVETSRLATGNYILLIKTNEGTYSKMFSKR